MPSIGARCHELRIDDIAQKKEWRIICYRERRDRGARRVREGDEDHARRRDQNCKRRLAAFKSRDEP